MTLTMNEPFVLPKVESQYAWSKGRHTRWSVPYQMVNSTLWDTPFKDMPPIFDWVVACRSGEFRDLTLVSASREKAEAVAVGAALDLIRQGGAVVNDSRALSCFSVSEIQETHRDKDLHDDLTWPVIVILEVPSPMNKWVWDAFTWASETRRRVHGVTVYWTREAVYSRIPAEDMELLRGAHVDLDAPQ